MPIRQRVRQQVGRYWEGYPSSPWYDSGPLLWTSEYISDSVPGPCSCLHYSYDAGLDFRSRVTNVSQPAFSCCENFKPATNYTDVLDSIAPRLNSLEWNRLPSSTELGLIQLFAEIDDTIALFTRRFWQQLSYGSFTWGVVPFVSDLVATAEAVSNLAENISSFAYETSERLPVELRVPWGPTSHEDCTGSCTVRRTGLGDISFQHFGSRALDWLGFHPDLATAWDLIPFSFVVDYLLPIGDYLESFRQGGWVQTMVFTGWLTIKCDVSITHKFYGSWALPYEATSRLRMFSRSSVSDVLVVQPNTEGINFEMPSLREMFNMLYLLIGRL